MTGIEVTHAQYHACRAYMSGIVAHRQEAGRYYVKLMLQSYEKQFKLILQK